MDEPFAALDALTRRTMQDELLRLWDETRFTVLFVTHSINEAIKVGNRILLAEPAPRPGACRDGQPAQGAYPRWRRRRLKLEHHIHELLFA